MQDEARHNLILGIAGTIRDRPGYYAEHSFWLVVHDGDDDVLAVALQTPPFNLAVARPAREGALEALARGIATEGVELPGVSGAAPEAETFADSWATLTGGERSARMRQRIYQASEIRAVAGVAGTARLATVADRELLIDWADAFNEEVRADAPHGDTAKGVDARLASDAAGFMLWEDGQPASIAGWGGATPNGVRVGPVYTPPDLRRRGYASAVTAAASASQLAAGRRFCFLYTDLANPTSNRIYMDLGYEPVCDAIDYSFGVARPSP